MNKLLIQQSSYQCLRNIVNAESFTHVLPDSEWPVCKLSKHWLRNATHYNDVIMGVIASQIISLTIVYSTVYSGADKKKYENNASLAFVRGIHRGRLNSRHKWPVTRKMFPFDDVIMNLAWVNNKSVLCRIYALPGVHWMYIFNDGSMGPLYSIVCNNSINIACYLTILTDFKSSYSHKSRFGNFSCVELFMNLGQNRVNMHLIKTYICHTTHIIEWV